MDEDNKVDELGEDDSEKAGEELYLDLIVLLLLQDIKNEIESN